MGGNVMIRDGNEASALAFSMEVRERRVLRMDQEVFDILVIGGGITGVGIARDAVLRGFKTALIEKDDFGAGTSSNSSKLVHGGFRYLRQLKFGLVREALVERKTLMAVAPHLVHPMRCILPIYQGSLISELLVPVGMWLYDLLAFDRRIGNHRMLSREELLEMEPAYRREGLRKGAAYVDCWADDFRLVMSTIQSAAQHGAVVSNYVEAFDAVMEKGRVTGVAAKDRITGKELTIRARAVVNATGPWSDRVRESLLHEKAQHLRLTKGVHAMVSIEDLPIRHALMQFAVHDGRPIFAIPWKRVVLLGTTDTDYGADLDHIPTERSDVDYLLESFNHYFPKARLTHDRVISTFVGLRPLILETGKPTSEVSREYQIFERPKHFFTIVGGKLTTHRTMAKKMVDRLVKRLDASSGVTARNPRCTTGRVPLFGGEIQNFRDFQAAWIPRLMNRCHWGEDIAEHLVETHGGNLPSLMAAVERTPDGMERIHPELPYVWGELTYAMDHEMALTLSDFLIRRTHMFVFDKSRGRETCQEVADRMERRLGWSAEEKGAQLEHYAARVRLTQHFQDEIPDSQEKD